MMNFFNRFNPGYQKRLAEARKAINYDPRTPEQKKLDALKQEQQQQQQLEQQKRRHDEFMANYEERNIARKSIPNKLGS
jgi:transcription initiation factor TFIID subunit TAF12